jgi:hypothetical protein
MKDDNESKRIIRRVGQESEATMATRIRRHMSGADADPDDWVEIWGTRIGRILSVVLAAVLVWWLIDFIRTL